MVESRNENGLFHKTDPAYRVWVVIASCIRYFCQPDQSVSRFQTDVFFLFRKRRLIKLVLLLLPAAVANPAGADRSQDRGALPQTRRAARRAANPRPPPHVRRLKLVMHVLFPLLPLPGEGCKREADSCLP